MTAPTPRSHARSLATLAAAACALALAPGPARASSHPHPQLARLSLLDADLSLDDRPVPVLTVARAAAEKPKEAKPGETRSGETKSGEARPGDASLDFDLLGKPPPTPQVDDSRMRRRRTLLKWHQGIGLGLFALQLATTTVGQLNYSDKYGASAPRTAKYEATHGVLAFTNVGVFAVNGTLALLAPSPKGKKHGFDRTSLHRLAMAVATAGMLAQGVTGIYANSREGYLNQDRWAKTHLGIGYVTFAAMSVGVGALVF